MAKPFLEARVKGFRIPWHVNFPEINLRFYLKRRVGGEDRRGIRPNLGIYEESKTAFSFARRGFGGQSLWCNEGGWLIQRKSVYNPCLRARF